MSKKDYTKFSKNQNGGCNTIDNESAPEVAYPLPEDDLPEELVVDPVLEPNSKFENIEQNSVTFGRVINCSKLNVRQYPTLHADVLCCLDENTEIEIDEDKSTSEFYAICTPTGLEGFCLKKFVEIHK